MNQVLIANQREIVQLLPMAECIEVMAGALRALAASQARLYVDRRESTLHEAGEFLIPKSEGRIGNEHIVGELGEVLSGKAPGRRSPGEITLFKSLGIAIEDLAAAHHVLQKALESRTGAWLEIGGQHFGSA